MHVNKPVGTTRFLTAAGIYTMLVGILFLQTVSAATITVTHFDDGKDDADGTCTLREAVRSANGGAQVDACELLGQGTDVDIELAAGTYGVDLSGGVPENEALSGDLDVYGEIKIRGVSAELTIIDGGTADSQERVFHVLSAGNVISSVGFSDLTIMGGHEPSGNGGNIGILDAEVSLTDVIVTGGRAIRGGGIDAAGLLSDVALVRAQILENEAFSSDGVGGGLFLRTGSARIEETVIERNKAGNGGGLFTSARVLRILESRFSDNEANTTIGEDAGCGGGVFIVGDLTDVEISRTLVSGNTATRGGGVCWAGAPRSEIVFSAIVNNAASENGGGIWATRDVTVRHSTISGNSAAAGAGIYTLTAESLFDSITLAENVGGGLYNEIASTVEYSLFADNEGGNCTGALPTGGPSNLEDTNTCAFPVDGVGQPSLVDTNPLLGPLADNGGTLPTHSLRPGSPAIDAYDSLDRPNCQMMPDQRTYPRGYPTKIGDGSEGDYQCDIGAFEFNAPFIVNSVDDTVDANTVDGRCEDASGSCTLRAAIMQASAIPFFNDIELGPATYSLTIPDEGEDDTESSGDLEAAGGMRLRGAGQDSTVIDVSAGAGPMRILQVAPILQGIGVRLLPTELQDLTISGGVAAVGGAIVATRPLELTRVTFRNNRATVFDGGAVLCSDMCRLTTTDSVFDNNSAIVAGGAIFHVGRGPLRIYGSTLTGNGAQVGGGIATTGALSAQNVTLSGNRATASAGAVFADSIVLNGVTIANNEAQQDAGALLASNHLTIANSIIAGNVVGATSDNCTANTPTSLGGNLSDTEMDDCGFDAASDLVLADPRLGPLSDNGGLTPTHALLSGSMAIDVGDAERCGLVDQRGFMRPTDGDGDGTSVCDIGAVEAQSADVGISVTATPNPVTVGGTVTSLITITNAGPEAAEAVVMMATLPTSFSSVSTSVTGTDADCNTAANQETCELGNLASGAELTVEITATAEAAGNITVSAETMSRTPDGAAGNDIAEATVTVNAQGAGGGNPGGGGGGGSVDSSGGGGSTHPLFLVLPCLALLRRYRSPVCRWSEGLGPLAVALLTSLPAAHADPVTDLISFSANTTARASEVNDNFSMLANAVNDNDGRIASMEAANSAARIEALEAEIAELKLALNNLMDVNPHVTMETVNGQPAIRLTGVNLQIVNGMDETATANGTGNLIVGYDEKRLSDNVNTDEECSLGTNPSNGSAVSDAAECTDAGGFMALNHKSGSHYVIVGRQANYTRWGGLVIGNHNTSNYDFASVSGGQYGRASGASSSISGGFQNTASGFEASVSGGAFHIASGSASSISGGERGRAEGIFSSIGGGLDNSAEGSYASVSAGWGNFASGEGSSVSGGNFNNAFGRFSTVSGGFSRLTNGISSWRAGRLTQDD